MCGIAGFVEKQNKEQALALLKNMGQSLHHRGPDSQGQYYDEHSGLGLAHTRLSILDLSPAGHQPMLSHGGRFVLVFNGEIYNWAHLKSLINKDFSFKGHSDTEILVNCIEQIGIEKTLKEANGMFAIAVLDKENYQLTLARDRCGEKPLYYSLVNHTLYFASELKALKANESWHDEIDVESLGLFMRHNYIPAPYSIYKNTYKLTPGTYITFDLNVQEGKIKNLAEFSPFVGATSLSPKVYWQLKDHIPEQRKEFSSPEMAVDQLNQVLEEVVSEIMVSDVPLGAFLSGGVDSSLVVSVMQKLSSQKVKTFSIGFTDTEYNEAPHAKAVAEHLGTEHTELYVTPNEAWQVVPKLAQIYDEPFADSSQIPTYLVSQLARREVTVSLSGDGGDELFGGYNRYFMATKIWDKVGLQPQWLKSLGAKSIETLPPQQWDQLFGVVKNFMPASLKVNQFGDKLYKASQVLKANTAMEMYLNLISYWQNIQDVVPQCSRTWSILNLLNENTKNLNPREQMMFLDFCSYLSEDILTKVDRASMAHSLESRIPLLDRRVIEFAWSLPLDLKIRNGQGKWLLRQLLYKYVPKGLIERPKMGFGVPVGDWIKGPLNDWAETLLSVESLNKSGLLHTANIRQRWQEHKSGTRNWHMSLWNVLMFQQWLINNTK
ncbi:MAG: asparagine synthase (glutamine-hydrolyzing) [Bdellovibrionaceae bacterium]|nr:asparagine synthase (glutamine-hydrolyzing) [Pseudobdellovibrionaceae bacterium]